MKKEIKENRFDSDSAEKELNRFMDGLKLTQMKKDDLEEEIDSLTQYIENGTVEVKDDNSIKYNLVYPIEDDEGEVKVSSISFRCRRVRVSDIEKKMVGKNDVEKTRKMMGFLSNENSGIFSKMDGDDFKGCGDIAAFFLPR